MLCMHTKNHAWGINFDKEQLHLFTFSIAPICKHTVQYKYVQVYSASTVTVKGYHLWL